MAFADAPAWLVGLVTAPTTGTVVPETLTVKAAETETERAVLSLEKRAPAVSGDGGHDATFGVVCRLVELFPSLGENALRDVLETCNVRCVPPWTMSELRHKVRDALRRAETVTVDVPQVEAEPWPVLHPDAYHGFGGEFVGHIDPWTEADPVALFVTFLATFGNAVGRSPHFAIGGGRHRAALSACLVGSSSRARKGTANGCVRAVFRELEFGQKSNGLGTGEGLVNAVRDDEVEQQDGAFFASGGVSEKRVLVTESEFARLLGAIGRKDKRCPPSCGTLGTVANCKSSRRRNRCGPAGRLSAS